MVVRSAHIGFGKDGQISPTRHDISASRYTLHLMRAATTCSSLQMCAESYLVNMSILYSGPFAEKGSKKVKESQVWTMLCSLKIKATILFFPRMI